jgi:hypothetical protein
MNMEEIKDTPTSDTFEPGEEKKGLSTGAKVGIGVGIVVGLIVILIIVGFMLDNPDTTATLRDMFIIVLAFQSLVVGTLLLILVYQLITLTQMLNDDLKPMIESTQETLNTVKGTATFVSRRVTKPAIKASGYVAGISRSIGVLVAMLPRRRGSNPGPASDDEATF